VPGKRILVFGITGIDKTGALERLRAHCGAEGRSLRIVNLENDYLFSEGSGRGSIPRRSFLAASPQRQRDEWNRAWETLAADITNSSDDIIVSLHGCYIRGHYGTRVILDPNKIAAINPCSIVTLVADVFDMWWRTESRADGQDWKGRPTLEQLILGRRIEVAVADQVALTARRRHLVLAVNHPCDTLSRFIFRPNVKVIYLSFPISEPRRMQAAGDKSGIDAVSAFIKYAHQRQRASQHLACVCPLAIDELPLKFAFDEYERQKVADKSKNADDEEDTFAFDRDAARWSLDDLWPSSERLAEPARPYGNFKVGQARDAAGNIKSDVTWRDYRLTEQADSIAVFCPVMKPDSNKLARGVLSEIAFATKSDIPVYIYQDPSRDKSGECAKYFNTGSGGTMESNPSGTLVKLLDSLEAVFNAIEKP
jgi:hypothetical protein